MLTQSINGFQAEAHALKREIALQCFASTEVCCKTLFPKRFEYPFSKAHKQVFAALDDPSIKRLCIAAWRGFGKSSILQLGYPAKRILSRNVKFIVPTSCTSTQALRQSENLKRELTSNPAILDIFGSMKSTDLFSQEMWMANNPHRNCAGTLVFPRGMGQQVRGIIHEDSRPDLIIVDDLEDKESVLSEEQRFKRKDYFFTDLLGSVDLSNPDTRILYIGTVMHEDSLLKNLLDDPGWTSMRFEICDDDLVSNWPERHTNDDIRFIYEAYERQGLLDQFYMEYRNLTSSGQMKPFTEDCFKYFDTVSPNAFHVVLVDPAKTTNQDSCDTAIVGVGIDTITSRIFVEDIIADRFHPDQMYAAACDMARRIGARYIGVEETGLNEFVSWPFRNYITMNKAHLQYVPLKARRGPSQYVPTGSKANGKDARISASLVPMYRQGLIYHKKEHPQTKRLESQLLGFPRIGEKDIIDALSYVSWFMSMGEQYMMGAEEVVENNLAMLQQEDKALAEMYGCSGFNRNWRF